MRPLSKSLRKSLAHNIAGYSRNLGVAEKWLGERGIPMLVAAEYSLGVVVDPAPGHEPARGRLAIPYFDAVGPTSIRFRALNDTTKPKYWAEPGWRPSLYNTGALLRSDTVAVTEGELDALVLDGLVGVPAVGVPGSGVWQPHWDHCFAGFSRVELFIDNDEAGNKLATELLKRVDNARRVWLPPGLDVNETFLAHGVEWFW